MVHQHILITKVQGCAKHLAKHYYTSQPNLCFSISDNKVKMQVLLILTTTLVPYTAMGIPESHLRQQDSRTIVSITTINIVTF